MIRIAETDEEIDSCYDVMSQLRPHLSREEFLAQVKRQIAESGYQLIYLADEGEVKAVAGIRVAEWLARGMSMDLEDLVATESDRSKATAGSYSTGSSTTAAGAAAPRSASSPTSPASAPISSI